MSSEEIVLFFRECIQQGDKLQNGKQLIEAAIAKVPAFCSTSCTIITNSQIDSQFRRLVGFIMKNILRDNWMTNPILKEEIPLIKNTLITGLGQNINDPKIIEILALTMAELIQQENVLDWQAHLLDIINWMVNKKEPAVINAACEALCAIFQKTDDRISIICPKLFPVLYQIFTLPDLSEKIREKVLVLLYLAIQSFSEKDETAPDFVAQCFDETYPHWIELFVSALQTSVKSNLNIKRYILKILTVIFREFRRYSKKTIIPIIYPVWKYLNSNLPLFAWNVVFGVPIENLDDSLVPLTNSQTTQSNSAQNSNSKLHAHEFQLDEDFEVSNTVEALTVQLIELMATLVVKKSLSPLIKFGLFPLINCLSHYMLLSKEQEMVWKEDPNQFIAENEDEANSESLRNAALKVLTALVEGFHDQATQTTMIVADKFLSNVKEESFYRSVEELLGKMSKKEMEAVSKIGFDNEKLVSLIKTSHFEVDSSWKKREIGLFLLGTFSEEIIDFQEAQNQAFNPTQLLEPLVKDIENGTSHEILKGRTIWCLSRFSNILSGENANLLLPLFKLSTLCLDKNNVYPVRLIAAKAFRLFAFKIEKLGASKMDDQTKTLYRLNDPKNIVAIWELVDRTSEDTVHLILEAAVQFLKLNPNFVPDTAELMHVKLLEIFKLFSQDIVIGPIIQELIGIFTQNPGSFKFVYNTFLPFVIKCLVTVEQGGNLNELKKGRETDEELLSGLLDIVTQITKCCTDQTQKEDLVNFIPKLVALALKSDDTGFLNRVTVCAKTFVIHNAEQILKHNLTPQIVKLIEKLLHPATIEEGSLFVGNLIILTFVKLLNNTADQSILQAVAQKISTLKKSSVVQSLVLVFARLINISDKDIINFLSSFNIEGQIGLKVLLDQWLLHQPLFCGRLAKLTTIEPLILTDVYAPVKILSIMIRCLDSELNQHLKASSTKNLKKDNAANKDEDVVEGDGLEEEWEDEEPDFGDDFMDNIDFGGNEDGEAGETMEEDLAYLKDEVTSMDLVEMLKKFFTYLVMNEKDYFLGCAKHLPEDDINLLKKYLNI